MANANFLTSGTVGANMALRTTTADFELGTVSFGNDGTSWIYVQADGAVATGTCTVNTSTFQLTDSAGNHTADVAFADNEYGWVRLTAGAS